MLIGIIHAHFKLRILERERKTSMDLGWFLGFMIGIVAIVSRFKYIAYVTPYNYWLLVIGFLLVSLSGGSRRF